MKRRIALALAMVLPAFLFLAGCTVGPNYRKPQISIPPAFRNAQPGAETAASLADLPWWDVFKDPVLQKLIRTGLEKNYDVRIAAEEIIAARAQVALSRSAQLPQVTLDPSYTGGKTGTATPKRQHQFPKRYRRSQLCAGPLRGAAARHGGIQRRSAGHRRGAPCRDRDSGQ